MHRLFLGLSSLLALGLAAVTSCDLAFPLHESGLDAANAGDAGEGGNGCGTVAHEKCLECCSVTFPEGAAELLAQEWKCACGKGSCTNSFTCSSTECDVTPRDGATPSCPGCVVSQSACPVLPKVIEACADPGSCQAFESCVIGCPKLVVDGSR